MIWIARGRGGWALWIPLLLIVVPVLADDSLHLVPKGHVFGWIIGSLALAAGILVATMGFYLNRGPGFWTIDSATGLRYFDTSARHSFYCIPIQYWGLSYCLLGIVIAVIHG